MLNNQLYILGLFSESISKMEKIFYKKLESGECIDIEEDICNYCKDLIESYNKNFLYENNDTDRIFRALIELYKQTQTKLLNAIYEKRNLYEKDLYKIFDKNINQLLGFNAKVVKKKNNNKHIPDRWIEVNNKIIPIEFKRYGFTSENKKQLRRYMEFYDCRFGIAIGECLKTKLDNDMMFISISDLKCGKSVAQQLQKNLKDMYIETTNRSTSQKIANRDREIEKLKNNIE